MKRLILLLALVAATANAQVTGEISIGGQTDDSTGGIARFRELSSGDQGGVFLEKLEIFASGPTRFELRSSFTTGKTGFLDLAIDNGPWRGGVRVSRNRSWSGLSFANDILPSGASVSTLYPYTTELDPIFRQETPSVDHTRAEAFLTRNFGDTIALTFRGGLRQRDGERVPNVGAFAFGDAGTAAFFAPGLEGIDSSSSWGAIEARTAIRNVALQIEAGAMQRENRADYAMPVYGTQSLIDISRWTQNTDANTTWLRASGIYARDRFSVEGGVSRIETSAAAGEGDVDATVTSGGIGTTLRLGAPVSLALSADVQSRENDGRGPAVTELNRDRIGATADLRMRFGKSTRVRVRGRVTTTESDVRESLSTYAQDLTRETDRSELRADVSTRFTKQLRGRAWGRIGREEQRVDLRQLDNGFTIGDSGRSDVAGGAELAFGSTLVTLSAARTDFENSEPYFDPVFDPSSILSVAEGNVTTLRATASSVWSFSHASVWGEAGWLSTEYRFDDVTEHAGFLWLDESVDGLVLAVGSEVHPHEALRITGNVEWVRDEDDLDRTLLRGSLELARMLRNNVELFGRWTTSDLDAPQALNDEFNADLFAIGVRTKF